MADGTKVTEMSELSGSGSGTGEKKMKAKSVATGRSKAGTIPSKVTSRRSVSEEDAVTALTDPSYGSPSKKDRVLSGGSISKHSVKSSGCRSKTRKSSVPSSRPKKSREMDVIVEPVGDDDEEEYAC